MTIEDMIKKYEQQSQVLSLTIEDLQPLLYKYHGADLYLLRKRIKMCKTLRDECDRTVAKLKHYYKEK